MAGDYRKRWSDHTSIYVTNFPKDTSQSELKKHCEKWGTIADVFISTRLSRFGKRFGFVRFTGVDNLQLLIDNLRTIWIGKFHMFADYARDYQQSKSNSVSKMEKVRSFNGDVKEPKQPISDKRTFADLFKSINSNKEPCKKKHVVIPIEVCLNAKKFNFVIAKVLDVSFIPNLGEMCVKEGFEDVLIRYIGGRWVSILFPNVEVASNFDKCEVLKNCFSCIQVLSQTFIPDERCVWLDIIGLPVIASTPAVLKRIGDLWGKFLFTGGDKEEPLAEGKICVLTSCKIPIYESIIVEVDGVKVEVWVKEFASWAPTLYAKETNLDTVSQRDECLSVEGDAHSQVTQNDETKIEAGMDDSQSAGSDILTNEFEVKSPTRSKDIPIAVRADEDQPDLNRKSDDKFQPQSYVEDNGNLKGHDQDGLTDIGGNVESETLPNLDEVLRQPDQKVQSLETAVPDAQSGIHAPVHQVIPTSPVPVVDATTLSSNPQPSFSQPNHVGTSKKAKSDSDNIWNYRDPTGKIHGPFSLAQLRKWREMGCFPNDFKIWRNSSTEDESLLLLYVLKKRATVNCTTNGSDIQKSRGSLKNSNGG